MLPELAIDDDTTKMAAGTKIEAMTAESAAAATASKTKRKSAPKEDEDESGDESDGSDVVSPAVIISL